MSVALFLNRTLVTGPRPTTDEASAFTCTLDLRWGRRTWYDHPQHMRFPLKGHQPYLNPHRVRAAVDAMDAFVARRNPLDRMLIHCENGINRTGSVVVAWLCRNGAPFDDAVGHFRKISGHTPRTKLLVWLRRHLNFINPP